MVALVGRMRKNGDDRNGSKDCGDGGDAARLLIV